MAWVNFERLYGVNGAIVSVLIYFLWTKKILAWFQTNTSSDTEAKGNGLFDCQLLISLFS